MLAIAALGQRATRRIRTNAQALRTGLGVVLALAALNGSFERGGAVIDQQLSIAAVQAEPPQGLGQNELVGGRADGGSGPWTRGRS